MRQPVNALFSHHAHYSILDRLCARPCRGCGVREHTFLVSAPPSLLCWSVAQFEFLLGLRAGLRRKIVIQPFSGNPSKNSDHPAVNRAPTMSAQMIAPTIPPPNAISDRVPSVATTESRHVNSLCLTNFQHRLIVGHGWIAFRIFDFDPGDRRRHSMRCNAQANVLRPLLLSLIRA